MNMSASTSEIDTARAPKVSWVPEWLRQIVWWRAALRLVGILVIGTAAYREFHYVAWIGDDAAITLRSVMNFLYGYGPVFNVGERVQAFTHPLWFFLLSLGTYLHPDLFKVTFAVSIWLSVAGVLLLTQAVCRSFLSSLIAAGILLTSKSYVDYAASGLENPLSNILLLLCVITSLRALAVGSTFSMATVGFLASLVYLTRADLVLLIAPLGIFIAARLKPTKSQVLKAGSVAILPVVAWTLFSVIYYGVPFPNTAYAKLGTGATLMDNILQGARYFQQSFSVDPITLMTILAGVLFGLISAGVDRMLGIGVILYLLYILRISGDFMSGRFFVAPLVMSLVVLARRPRMFPLVGIGLAVCGVINFKSAILVQENVPKWDENGIADERRYYWPLRNLEWLQSTHALPNYQPLWLSYDSTRIGTIATAGGGLGYMGLQAGPSLHLVDSYGLSDPLLARLPSLPKQRVGHWERIIPTNYVMSVADDSNQLVDEDLKSYYEKIRLVTRGPLFSKERWMAIAALNVGRKPDLSRWATSYSKPVDENTPRVIPLARLRSTAKDFGACTEVGNVIFGKKSRHFGNAVEITLPPNTTINRLDIALDGQDRFRFEYWHEGRFETLFEVGPSTSPAAQSYVVPPSGSLNPEDTCMTRYQLPVGEVKPVTDRLRVVGLDGEGLFSIGHLRID